MGFIQHGKDDAYPTLVLLNLGEIPVAARRGLVVASGERDGRRQGAHRHRYLGTVLIAMRAADHPYFDTTGPVGLCTAAVPNSPQM